MARRTITKFIPVIVASVFAAGYQSLAQQSGPPSVRQLKEPPTSVAYDDSESGADQNIQLLAQELKSQKKQMVAANMDLTDSEAEKFWPVYDRYAADLAKIYDTKLALVGEYFENYRTMNGDDAERYIRRRAAVEEDVMQLRIRYVPEFRKVLSGRQTALFFQIEWRLDLMLNLQLAQAPVIDP
jgi:hypothetical protein